jgi:hypothetical protein
METTGIILTIIGTTISVVSCMCGVMNFLLKRERNIALRDKRICDIENKINELPCGKNGNS